MYCSNGSEVGGLKGAVQDLLHVHHACLDLPQNDGTSTA